MNEPKSLQQFIRQSGETTFKMELITNEEEFIELKIHPEAQPENTFIAVIERNETYSQVMHKFKQIAMKHIKKQGKFTAKNLYRGSKADLDKH